MNQEGRETPSGVESNKRGSLTPEERKILSEVEEMTRLRTGDVDHIHGIEHVETVAWIAEYLANQEGADVFEATAAAWFHDWGRVREPERRERGDKKPHAAVSREKSQRLVLQTLLEEGTITEKEYQRILVVIDSHSKLPEGKMLEKKILRDADRISRFSAIGLQQVVKFAIEFGGKPFYLEGQPVLDPQAFLTPKDLKCAIDDINFAIQWYEILETKAGRQLVDRFRLLEIYKNFLKTFGKYKNDVSQEVWLKWIDSVVQIIQGKREALKEVGGVNNKEVRLEDILVLESPELFNEESFREFLEKDEE